MPEDRRMSESIVFNKIGHDSFIDFIKAYAIICVLIGHTLPVTRMGYGLWAGMQVPLFILVQVFHFYKKENARLSVKKLLNRIVMPFFVFWLIEFVFYIVFERHNEGFLSFSSLLSISGPGSYYPFVYLQIAFLLPVFRYFCLKLERKYLLVLFLVLAEGLELLCSFLQPPEWLFRLLAFRYVFLIYLGWLWVKEGVSINLRMILLSVISLLSIIYFEYLAKSFSINNEPWFFNTIWSFHRWPCYYYVANGLIYVLNVIWRWIREFKWPVWCIEALAKSTYEIFLVQMASIYLIRVSSFSLPIPVMAFLIWSVSILGGIGLHSHIYYFSQKNSA